MEVNRRRLVRHAEDLIIKYSCKSPKKKAKSFSLNQSVYRCLWSCNNRRVRFLWLILWELPALRDAWDGLPSGTSARCAPACCSSAAEGTCLYLHLGISCGRTSFLFFVFFLSTNLIQPSDFASCVVSLPDGFIRLLDDPPTERYDLSVAFFSFSFFPCDDVKAAFLIPANLSEKEALWNISTWSTCFWCFQTWIVWFGLNINRRYQIIFTCLTHILWALPDWTPDSHSFSPILLHTRLRIEKTMLIDIFKAHLSKIKGTSASRTAVLNTWNLNRGRSSRTVAGIWSPGRILNKPQRL